MSIQTVLAVATGGALGSVARYAFGTLAARLLGTSFPWGTLAINVTGSFLMGAFVALFATRWDLSETGRIFLTVGVCGGYTTFSTFSLDAYGLIERGAGPSVFAYVIASILLSIGALATAMFLVRSMSS
jgi:CrcB protein